MRLLKFACCGASQITWTKLTGGELVPTKIRQWQEVPSQIDRGEKLEITSQFVDYHLSWNVGDQVPALRSSDDETLWRELFVGEVIDAEMNVLQVNDQESR